MRLKCGVVATLRDLYLNNATAEERHLPRATLCLTFGSINCEREHMVGTCPNDA